MNRLAPLGATFAVLAALVAWKELSRGSAKTLSQEANLKPLQIRPFTQDDVGSVEVTAPGADHPAYKLVREDKAWRVVGEFKAPASGAAIVKLLDALAKAEGEFRTDDKAALEQFGLTHAKATGVRVLDKEGKELVHVEIGATANQRGAFVRDLAADDSKAYSVGSDVRAMLGLSRTSVGNRDADKPDAAHFHDKEFPQVPVEKPTKVEFAAPGRVVTFEKNNDKSGWKAAAGGPDAAPKKEAIDAAIAKLGGSFHPTGLVDPAKKKELGFDAPKWRLAVTTESGAPRVVTATSDAAGEKFYVHLEAAQDPDVVYESQEYEFRQLFPAGASLFDLPKVDTSKDPPTRVIVEKKGRETIEIARKGSKPSDDWTLVRPAWPLVVKQQQLRQLSTQPGAVHVADYVDDATPPDAEVVVRFGAAGAPDDQLKTIVIGGKAPEGKNRLATLPGKPERVLAVADNILDRIAPEPLSLFETKVFKEWKRDDVTAARVPGVVTVVKDGDAWKLDSAEGKPAAEKAAVETWLDKVLSLDVTGLPAADAKDEPATTPTTTIVLERKEGAPVSLQLGPAEGGKRVVKIGEFRATVADVPGLVPDAGTFAVKAPEPAKKDEPPKDDEKK